MDINPKDIEKEALEQMQNVFMKLFEEKQVVERKLKDCTDFFDRLSFDWSSLVDFLDDNTQSEKIKLKDFVINLLQRNNRPMSANELREGYEKVTRKSYARKDFASRLSFMRRSLSLIKNAVITKATGETVDVWGLSEWFDGENLKPIFNREK